MVWAAAYAHAIAKIDWANSSNTKMDEEIGTAVGLAYCAVVALRKLATVRVSANTQSALTMLREMTDPPEKNN